MSKKYRDSMEWDVRIKRAKDEDDSTIRVSIIADMYRRP
jgi:hypothetical protein